MRLLRRRSRTEGGWTTAFAISMVLLCAAIAGSSLTVNLGSQKEAQALLARERAFQAAEAGVDWALVRLRIRHGVVPTPNDETLTLNSTARATLRYRTGTTNGLDDDGNGIVDDLGEGDFTSITSTGIAGGVRRTLQVVLRKAVILPTFNSATYIDDAAPILDLKGDAFVIQGAEHTLDGTLDALRPPKYGITSPAAAAALIAQITAKNRDNITGLGGMPSIGQEQHPDLPLLIESMRQAATVVIQPGTVTNGEFGTPTDGGMQVAHCIGDLHLSGGFSGAGVLVVDGDLIISGAFTWTGIVLVTGRVTMTGGGSTKRVVGAMTCGEEVITIAGTVDLLYSSDAIRMASTALSVPVMCSWREVGNP